MEYTREILLQFVPSGDIPVVHVKQGDASTRFIRATIIKDHQKYIPGAEQTILFREEKPDGHAVLLDNINPDSELGRYFVVVNDDGTVTVELTAQTTACAGKCRCDLCFVQSDRTISTAQFVLDVEEAPDVSNIAVSSDDFKSLVEALGKVWDAGVVSVPGSAVSGTITLGTEWEGNDPYTYEIPWNYLPKFATFPTKGGADVLTITWNESKTAAHISGTTSGRVMVGLYDPLSMSIPSVLTPGVEYRIKYSTSDPNIKLYVDHNAEATETAEDVLITFNEDDSFTLGLRTARNVTIDADIEIGMYEAGNRFNLKEGTYIQILNDADVLQQMDEDGITRLFITNDAGVLTAHAFGGRPSVSMTVPVVFTDTDSATFDNVQDGQIIAYDGRSGTWTNRDLSDYGLPDETAIGEMIEAYGYQTEAQVRLLIQDSLASLDANNIRY